MGQGGLGNHDFPGRPTLARETPQQIAQRATPSFDGGKPNNNHGTTVKAESAERKWRDDATKDGRSNEPTAALCLISKISGSTSLYGLRRRKNCELFVAGRVTDLLVPSSVRLAAFVTQDRKSTRLNSSHRCISYAVF